MSLSRIKNRLLAKVFTAVPSLAVLWARGLERDTGGIPWSEPQKPLREATVGLVTTGGVHLRTGAPFDMGDPDGDPSYREVPAEVNPADLTITHDYYDHTDAEIDINLVLPLDRLHTLQQEGVVGSLHPVAYSFMGHIDGRHLETLRERTAKEVTTRMREAGVDYALLVPA